MNWGLMLIWRDIVCCIYHAPKAVGESSSEDDSSSSSDSDSDDGGGGSGPDDTGEARMVGGRKSKRKGRGHRHGHDHDHEHGDECGGEEGKKVKRKPSPNAYEKMPKSGGRHEHGHGMVKQ